MLESIDYRIFGLVLKFHIGCSILKLKRSLVDFVVDFFETYVVFDVKLALLRLRCVRRLLRQTAMADCTSDRDSDTLLPIACLVRFVRPKLPSQ